MRPISNRKNLTNLTLKLSAHQSKQLNQPSNRRHSTFLLNAQEVIFNTQALPILIDLSSDQLTEVSVVANFSTLTVKNKWDMVSLPWQLQHQSWIHLTFGQTYKKVQIKTQQNENKISQLYAYSSIHIWKKLEQHQQQPPYQYCLASALTNLKKNTPLKRASLREKNHQPISTKQNIRISERANTYSHKLNLPTLKSNELRISQWYELKEQKNKGGKGYKLESQILSSKGLSQIELSSLKRNSNTSTSMRSDSQDFKWNRRPIRHKHLLEDKMVKPIEFQEDILKNIPNHQSHYRPKFYQQTPITLEQIQLKRKKFQSQFISKKAIPLSQPQQPPEAEQCEVEEEIYRPQQSNFFHGLEQTFEKGIEQPASKAVEQSGTLYQSVYE